MKKNLEPQIKVKVINYLICKNILKNTDTLINEFNIGDFSRRVDLALIKEDRMFAFEIKSEGDTLIRLKAQVEKYLEYFDKVTVITSPQHSKKALSLTPENVALWEVNESIIRVLRKGKTIINKDKLKMLQLMTAKDLRKVAKKNNIVLNSTQRNILEKNLIFIPSTTLRENAIKSLKDRYEKVNLAKIAKITVDDFSKNTKKLIAAKNRPEDTTSFIESLALIENELN